MSLQIPQANTLLIAGLLKRVTSLLNLPPDTKVDETMWPVRVRGKVQRVPPLGIPGFEGTYHESLEQGRMKEQSLNDALASLRNKKYDMIEKVDGYLNLNRLATTTKLPHIPRVVKLGTDIAHFIGVIEQYVGAVTSIEQTMTANLSLLNAVQGQSINMITRNLLSITTLIDQVCNWNLPDIQSIPAQLGGFLSWGGYNFNALSGFTFNTGIGFNPQFTYSSCIRRVTDLSQAFATPPSSGQYGGLVATTTISYVPPYGGVVVPVAALEDPAYVETLAHTPTLVLLDSSQPMGSLPNPVSIVSNFFLPAEDYQANITSLVPDLLPAVSSQSSEALRQGITLRVNLAGIVESNFDPNLVAAWLFLLRKNRVQRAGTWLPALSAVYEALVQPTLTYLDTTEVPFSAVGGVLSNHPKALPILTSTEANLWWRLSYVEASLLGCSRNLTWDTAADDYFATQSTGTSLDYPQTSLSGDMVTGILGEGKADYPVTANYPVALESVLSGVLAAASHYIGSTPGFETNRAQFKYVFSAFSEVVPVDRYTQFWREFNANLKELLQEDPYTASFIAGSPGSLAGYLIPNADRAFLVEVRTDASSRNKAWIPGQATLNLPAPLTPAPNAALPTALSSGWAGDEFDSAAFLSRPDVQAQSIPVQAAMLRTNQSYASLLKYKSDIQEAFATAISTTQAAISVQPLLGWSQYQAGLLVGTSPVDLLFSQVNFDRGSYIHDQTVTTSKAGNYGLTVDIGADAGVLGLVLLVNGTPVHSFDSAQYIQGTTSHYLAQGDTVTLMVTNRESDSSNVFGSFVGIYDSEPGSQTQTSSTTDPSESGRTVVVDSTVAPLQALIFTAQGATKYSLGSGTPPVVDAVALTAGTTVSITMMYGEVGKVIGSSLIPGRLIYVGSSGQATQTAPPSGWIIVLGKALTADTFVFQPQVPLHT